MSRRFLWSAALPLVAAAIYLAAGPARSVRAQDDPLPTAEIATGIRVVLGIGDAQPTDWSGSVEGNARALVGGRRESRRWKLESNSSPLKLAGGGKEPRVLPASLMLLPHASAETLRMRTAQGEFSFDSEPTWNGSTAACAWKRRPPAVKIGRTGVEEDFVAAAAGADGVLWLAYTVYESGRALDAAAALAGAFDSVEFDGNGDRGDAGAAVRRELGLGRPSVLRPERCLAARAVGDGKKEFSSPGPSSATAIGIFFSRVYDPQAEAFQAERRPHPRSRRGHQRRGRRRVHCLASPPRRRLRHLRGQKSARTRCASPPARPTTGGPRSR